MLRKKSLLITGLITLSALGALTLLVTAPSWSSPALLFVSSTAPENLPTAGYDLTLHGSGFSQETRLWLVPEHSIRTAITATLETFGSPYQFVSRDDRLYVANGARGFFIVQGVQSLVPRISGNLESGGQGLEVALHRDTALLAAGNNGLQLIDIRDDSNPQLLSALNALAPALSVVNSASIVYVARGKSGVEIVDIADPRHPRRLGVLPDLPAAYKLAINGNILVISTTDGGWLYDISQPTQPRRLAALPVPGGNNTVMVRWEETLYWATKSAEGGRLYALDISRPFAPRLLRSVPLSGTPLGISCNAEQLAVALGSYGVQLFSLQEPQLTASSSIAAKGRSNYALFLGSDLWIADSSGELLRLDQEKGKALTTSPLLPNLSQRINPIVTPQLFSFGDRKKISLFDHWNETAPVLLAQLPVTGLAQQYLSADQQTLWLATRDKATATTGKLLSVDISLPHAPRMTGQISFPHAPVIIGEYGTTLVITSQTSGQPLIDKRTDRLDSLHFIDISQPESPILASTYDLGDSSTGISLTESSIVLMQTDGLLRVIDISATEAPKEVGTLQMPWLHTAAWAGRVNIVVKDDVAFVSSSLGKIFLIDLHDQQRPEYLGDFTFPAPVRTLLLSDHLLLVELNKEGLLIFDLKESRAPAILGTIPLPGRFHRLTVQGGKIWYTHDDSNGLYSLPLPRRLQNSDTDHDQIIAHLAQSPPPGPYRLWLTDKGKNLLVPGVSWHSR
ncbi:MAG: hypothetical protein IBX46_03730 [Desulfuromonadales bacterium]|nr:hypothetical protein [Desulfuromonadales bacterium]